MTDIDFSHPWILHGLWLAPAAFLWLLYAGRGYRRRWQMLIPARRGDALGGGSPSRLRLALKASLLAVALALMVLAAAGPRSGAGFEEAKTSGVDVLVAIDVSRSMEAEDVKPSRLVQAKREVLDLLKRMQGDRVGIIAFAGISFVQCPLTADYDTLRLFLDSLEPGVIPSQGTSMASAMNLAAVAFAKGSAAYSAGKALLVITDGEDQESGPVAAARKLREQDVLIYVMGIGTPEGAPIPLPEGGFKKDGSGQMVLSRLEEGKLMDITREGGGVYVRSVPGEGDLDRIWDQGIKKDLKSGERESGRRQKWNELFPWFLWPAVAALVLEYLLSPVGRRRRRALSPPSDGEGALTLRGFGILLSGWMAVGGVPVPGWGGEARAGDREDAAEAFTAGRYDEAVAAYLRAEVRSPHDEEIRYNRAVAQYRAGKYEDAEKGFASLLTARNADIAGKAAFNRGNAAAMAKNLDQAEASFREFLEKTPDSQEAKDNLAWVLGMQEQQKQQQQQEGQQNKEEQEKGQAGDSQSQDGSEQKESSEGGESGSSENASGAPDPSDSGRAEGKDSQAGEKASQDEGQGDPQKKESGQDEASEDGKKESRQGQGEPSAEQQDANDAVGGTEQGTSEIQDEAADGKAGGQAAEAMTPEEKKAAAAAAGEPQIMQQAGQEPSGQDGSVGSEGQLSRQAAERLLRRVGQRSQKVHVPVPGGKGKPEQQTNRDW